MIKGDGMKLVYFAIKYDYNYNRPPLPEHLRPTDKKPDSFILLLQMIGAPPILEVPALPN
jgi:hypothetical protein